MSIPLRLNGARASACGVCSAGDAHSIRIFCTCNSRCSASSKCKRVSPKTALKPLVREQAPLLLIGITKAFAAPIAIFLISLNLTRSCGTSIRVEGA